MSKMKKAISLLLIFVLFVNPLSVKAEDSSSATPLIDEDLNIDKEKSQINQIFNISKSLTSSFSVNSLSDNLNVVQIDSSLFSEFVPEDAKINEVTVTDAKTVSIDYEIDSQRTIVSYYEDGKVRKTTKDPNEDLIKGNFNDESLEIIDMNEMQFIERSPEDIEKIDSLLEDKKIDDISKLDDTSVNIIDGQTYIQIADNSDNFSIAAAAKRVYPAPNDPTFTTRYKAKQVYGSTFFSNQLNSLGFNGNTRVRVYETLDYFTEVNTGYKLFTTSNTIDAVALFWDVSRGTTIAWLGWFGVAYTVYDNINQAINAVKQYSFDYQGGKEATVEDPTRHNSNQVEVVEYWNKGRITLGWTYNSSTGYQAPRWSHTTKSSALDMSNTVVASNGINNYNGVLNQFKSWIHGVGQLGY
ncbi:hypothetical protein BK129_04775 [Paenibacillus amylolyticus]|uniref:hypothetical protein n=2 Tax=Paenibacillus TaxID=44249 RepID=UPI00096CE40A|nr:hypothetical protein [Paenibacillus xylanexedens]MCP1425424.1 hypothetical protein [Paenibacillus xylanexedens]OMF10141.1 hypothetical protein BK129_04775 [Paenibacillus amylolyticus]